MNNEERRRKKRKIGIIGGIIVLLFIGAAAAMVFIPPILKHKEVGGLGIIDNVAKELVKTTSYHNIALGTEVTHKVANVNITTKEFELSIFPLVGLIVMGLSAIMMLIPLFNKFRFSLTAIFLGVAAGAFFTLHMFVRIKDAGITEFVKDAYVMSMFQIIGGSCCAVGSFTSLIFAFAT